MSQADLATFIPLLVEQLCLLPVFILYPLAYNQGFHDLFDQKLPDKNVLDNTKKIK
jgi:hypothetical protein